MAAGLCDDTFTLGLRSLPCCISVPTVNQKLLARVNSLTVLSRGMSSLSGSNALTWPPWSHWDPRQVVRNFKDNYTSYPYAASPIINNTGPRIVNLSQFSNIFNNIAVSIIRNDRKNWVQFFFSFKIFKKTWKLLFSSNLKKNRNNGSVHDTFSPCHREFNCTID